MDKQCLTFWISELLTSQSDLPHSQHKSIKDVLETVSCTSQTLWNASISSNLDLMQTPMSKPWQYSKILLHLFQVAKGQAFRGEPCQVCEHVCYIIQIKARGKDQTCSRCALSNGESLEGHTALCHFSLPKLQELARKIKESKVSGPAQNLSLDLSGLTEEKPKNPALDQSRYTSPNIEQSKEASLNLGESPFLPYLPYLLDIPLARNTCLRKVLIRDDPWYLPLRFCMQVKFESNHRS